MDLDFFFIALIAAVPDFTVRMGQSCWPSRKETCPWTLNSADTGMQRKDKEITSQETIEAVIKKALVCRIGLSDGQNPYVVPVCFGYKERSLYFHSASSGEKNGHSQKESTRLFGVRYKRRHVNSIRSLQMEYAVSKCYRLWAGSFSV